MLLTVGINLDLLRSAATGWQWQICHLDVMRLRRCHAQSV